MKAVDLFCGCGGLSRGFEDAGIGVIAAYDNWGRAVECYSMNFSHPACLADLADVGRMVEHIAGLEPNIIIGGPPCQDFSHAGKRQEGSRADLTGCFARIVAAVKPKWFVMENVDRAKSSRAYQAARSLFMEAGYGLTEEVLNARDFGVPQNRRRFFCIGLLGDGDIFLSHSLNLQKQARQITVREYFESIGVTIDTEHYYRHPRNYSRRGVFSIDEQAPTVRGVNRPIPEGYAGHDGDTHRVADVRPLTTRERALIQTFPVDFELCGSKTVVEQLIGNAVPVKLAEAVARSVLTYEQACGDEGNSKDSSRARREKKAA